MNDFPEKNFWIPKSITELQVQDQFFTINFFHSSAVFFILG